MGCNGCLAAMQTANSGCRGGGSYWGGAIYGTTYLDPHIFYVEHAC